MAVIVDVEGFESQVLSVLQFGVNGFGVFDTITDPGSGISHVAGRKAGTQALQVVQNSSATYVARIFHQTTTLLVGTLFFKVSAAPASNSMMYRIWGLTNQALGMFRFDAAGTISAFAADVNRQVTAATYADSNWHYIDFIMDCTNTTWTLDWKVDGGTAQTRSQVTGQVALTQVAEVAYGTTRSGDVLTCIYDDAAYSQTSGDYPLGAYVVEPLMPNGEGANESLGSTNPIKADDGTNSNLWLRVDDWITGVADTTTYITYNSTTLGDAATHFAEITFADTSSTVIDCVKCYAALFSSGNTANSAITRIVDSTNATLTDIYSGDMSETSLHYRTEIVAAPGGSWSQSEVNGLKARLGLASSVGSLPRWSAILLVAAYPDAGVPATPTPSTVVGTAAQPAVTTTATAEVDPNAVVATAAQPAVTVNADAKVQVSAVVATGAVPQATILSTGADATPAPPVVVAIAAVAASTIIATDIMWGSAPWGDFPWGSIFATTVIVNSVAAIADQPAATIIEGTTVIPGVVPAIASVPVTAAATDAIAMAEVADAYTDVPIPDINAGTVNDVTIFPVEVTAFADVPAATIVGTSGPIPAPTILVADGSTTDTPSGTPFTDTLDRQPVAGSVIMATIEYANASADGAPTPPTTVVVGGVTLTQVTVNPYKNSGVGQYEGAATFIGAGAWASDQLSIDGFNKTVTACLWEVVEIIGAATGNNGMDAIVQTAIASGFGNAGIPTTATLGNPVPGSIYNRVIAFFAENTTNTSVINAQAGFVTIADIFTTVPSARLLTMWDDTSFSQTGGATSDSGSSDGVILIELAAAVQTFGATPIPTVVAATVDIPATSGYGDNLTTPATVVGIALQPAIVVTADATIAPNSTDAISDVPAVSVIVGNQAVPAVVAAIALVPDPFVTGTTPDALALPAVTAIVASVPTSNISGDVIVQPTTVAAIADVPATTFVGDGVVFPVTVVLIADLSGTFPAAEARAPPTEVAAIAAQPAVVVEIDITSTPIVVAAIVDIPVLANPSGDATIVPTVVVAIALQPAVTASTDVVLLPTQVVCIGDVPAASAQAGAIPIIVVIDLAAIIGAVVVSADGAVTTSVVVSIGDVPTGIALTGTSTVFPVEVAALADVPAILPAGDTAALPSVVIAVADVPLGVSVLSTALVAVASVDALGDVPAVLIGIGIAATPSEVAAITTIPSASVSGDSLVVTSAVVGVTATPAVVILADGLAIVTEVGAIALVPDVVLIGTSVVVPSVVVAIGDVPTSVIIALTLVVAVTVIAIASVPSVTIFFTVHYSTIYWTVVDDYTYLVVVKSDASLVVVGEE